MNKYKTISQGGMTVGEIAEKADVTVWKLQHYDREGLLSPSATSEGGRRLYTDKDILKLHQILSLKHLGFPLSFARFQGAPHQDFMSKLLMQHPLLSAEVFPISGLSAVP